MKKPLTRTLSPPKAAPEDAASFLAEMARALEAHPPFRTLRTRIRSGPFPLEIEGPSSGFLSLLAGLLAAGGNRPSLVLVPTEQEAEALVQDLALLPASKAAFMPWFGALPYTGDSALPSILGARAHLLFRLLAGEKLLAVASIRSFLTPLPPRQHLQERSLILAVGEPLDGTALAARLQEAGYLRVPRVSLKGEFALRGEVVDIHPYGEEEAFRLVLDFERIGEIRRFNPITQASTGQVEKVRLPPVREVSLSEKQRRVLGEKLASSPNEAGSVAALLEALERDPEHPGQEQYFPLAFEKPCSLLDYLPEGGLIFLAEPERLQSAASTLRRETLELYKRIRPSGRALPAPSQILLDYPELAASHPRRVLLHGVKGGAGEVERIRIACEGPRSFFGNISFLSDELKNLLAAGYRVGIFAVYAHQAERLAALLKGLAVGVFPESLSGGFCLPELKILAIQEHEIFGRKKRIPRSLVSVRSQAIDSFVDLSPGEAVVHLNYGIGMYQGIERVRAAGNERDYIRLEYDGGEQLFLPIEQVNLIQRYIGQEGRIPRLDRLGGKGWEAKKERVRRSVEDLARRLVRLYSQRRDAQGYAFPPDSDWQEEFEAGFPFQETEDQLHCIQEVKGDMERPSPMDRLICGDVGYGKTEIALRAAFKAVSGGKQVAYLAPTTILAEQHFETFTERFTRFPVRIEMLSRFVPSSEQKRVVKEIREGGVDIVIGTHRILQRDVHFKNLGLMVVDEEQRFGVRDKERLKEIKVAVDCLTLTATPIPRTLHMALMKIRDMSLINTPPQNRLPIETFIQEYDPAVIARAIREEVARGGQVYFLHNRVQTMSRVHGLLSRLIPEISVATAHGQMDEEELEEVMHRFIRGDFHVLLSTSIIENGLDIPNVNTIIIDRADIFGISQLYQLRGRVGRSDRPAYAYLLYPESRSLSELAMKRLRIISDFTELGSGFKIALKDLEIRGAGNLLGREQHGDILAVGLDLYLRLLEEAIADLKEEKGEPEVEVYLELEYSGFIPDAYSPEPLEKMEIYKKIAAITTTEELEAVHREIADRFGPLPEEVESIMAIAEIRALCRRLRISSLKEREGVAVVEFTRVAELDVDKVLRLIKESGGSIYLSAKRPNCLFVKTAGIGLKEKSQYLSERLSRLL